MIDWVELSRAIPYAGVAIIFGLFMVIILRLVGQQRQEERSAQDIKDQRLAQMQIDRDKARDQDFISALERRDQDWREFMSGQQAARNEQWTSVVLELRQLAHLISLSTDLLRTHDAWERGMMMALQQRRVSDAQSPFGQQGEGGTASPAS